MQGILLQIRYFERQLSKGFKKDNFIFLSNRMSSVCHSNVIRMPLVCILMYSMSLVYTRMSSVCHSYVLVCHPYVICIYSYVTRVSLVCTRMLSVCHSYVLVCDPYVTRMYSYVTRMSLVCSRMSSVYHWYVVLPWTHQLLDGRQNTGRNCLIRLFHSIISKQRSSPWGPVWDCFLTF